jgi:hypothetical protein
MTILDEEPMHLLCWVQQGHDLLAMARCYFPGSGVEEESAGTYFTVEHHVTRTQSSYHHQPARSFRGGRDLPLAVDS